MEFCLDDMGGRQRDHARPHCAAQQHIDERRPSQRLARIHEGPKRLETLRDMRLDSLRMMRLLVRFRPRLIGSVRTGHVRKGSDIDLHIFCDSLSLVTDTLDERGLQYDVEHKRIVKYGEERTFAHIHLNDGHKFELTLYPEDKVHFVFKSSITGKAIECASIAELEEILRAEHPNIDLEADDLMLLNELDRRGWARGAPVCELDQALDFLRELADHDFES